MAQDKPRNFQAPTASAVAGDAPVDRPVGFPNLEEATEYVQLVIGGTVVNRPKSEQPIPAP